MSIKILYLGSVAHIFYSTQENIPQVMETYSTETTIAVADGYDKKP